MAGPFASWQRSPSTKSSESASELKNALKEATTLGGRLGAAGPARADQSELYA